MLKSNSTTCVEFVSKHIRTNSYVDFMLAAVNYCRKLGIDPNVAMEKACGKFAGRFRLVEKGMKEKGLEMKEENDGTMMDLWSQVKGLL